MTTGAICSIRASHDSVSSLAHASWAYTDGHAPYFQDGFELAAVSRLILNAVKVWSPACQ